MIPAAFWDTVSRTLIGNKAEEKYMKWTNESWVGSVLCLCCMCCVQFIPAGSAVSFGMERWTTTKPTRRLPVCCMHGTYVVLFSTVCVLSFHRYNYLPLLFLLTLFLRRLHFCCWSRRDYVSHTVSFPSNGLEGRGKSRERKWREPSSLTVLFRGCDDKQNRGGKT